MEAVAGRRGNDPWDSAGRIHSGSHQHALCYPVRGRRVDRSRIGYAGERAHRDTVGVPSSAGIVSGFCGGVLGGLAALPGPVVFIYMIGKGLHGKAFTKEASLFLVISSGLLALALSSTGVFSLNDWSLSFAALAPVLFGMYLGRHLRDRLNAESFRRIILVVVIASGFGLAERSLARMYNSARVDRSVALSQPDER